MARRWFSIVFLVAFVALLWGLAISPADQSFTLGVPAAAPMVKVERDQVACQEGIRVPERDGFRSIVFVLGTYKELLGPGIGVEVKSRGRVLARGAIEQGYSGADPIHVVRLDREVGDAQTIDVCIRNEGRKPVAIFGDGGSEPVSKPTLDGQDAGGDLAMVFTCGCDRSKLSRLGAALHASALFKLQGGSFVPVILLALLVIVAVPLLLWRAAGPPRE